MITKENKLDKICSFYASDYHLEMIMIPYINRKIEENAQINIITEKNLQETVEVVISRINLPKKRKEEILNIGWNNKEISQSKTKENMKKEQIIFVVGNQNYIKNINEEIKKQENSNITKIIDCYDISEIQKDMTNIISNHNKVLNTIEEKELV